MAANPLVLQRTGYREKPSFGGAFMQSLGSSLGQLPSQILGSAVTGGIDYGIQSGLQDQKFEGLGNLGFEEALRGGGIGSAQDQYNVWKRLGKR